MLISMPSRGCKYGSKIRWVVAVAQAQYPVALLNEQYRMHTAISTWCTVSAKWLRGVCILPDADVLQIHGLVCQLQA